MIDTLIAWSIRQRALVLLTVLALVAWGAYAAWRAPLDALPDLSENQVIVMTDWPGRSPQIVEDQVTYPLVTSLQGLPGVRTVRAASGVGLSMVYVIFEDEVETYWARTRVLERLAQVGGRMPAGVTPMMGPDGTGVGHVFWYVLEGQHQDLGELRAIQDWYLRYQLGAVPGVAEVASFGGFQRQYQVDLDPRKMAVYGVSVADVAAAVRGASLEVGGDVLQSQGAEYLVRGRGYVRDRRDLERVVLRTDARGVSVTLGQVAVVQLGPAPRRGLADWNGRGEAVGGIVVLRRGENAQVVIDRVKARLAEAAQGLPPGVRVVTAYDRSDLIRATVATLRTALWQEILIVSLVILAFLYHLRSALVVILTIPAAVLMAFIPMVQLGITSNIMSLGGLALAVGDLVDAGVVMTENAYRHLAEARARGENPKGEALLALVTRSSQEVGRAIVSAILVIVVSFLPVLMLTGQEGKLFSPLALLKTFALLAAALLAVTAVPALIPSLLRGRLRDEADIPLVRLARALYRPVLDLALRFRVVTLVLAVLASAASVPLALSRGSEFMPDLDEGSLLFMPITVPNINIDEAKRLVTLQDRLIMQTPEVASVLGKVGRADTATDPAPVSMFESIIMLKPRDQWRTGMTRARLVAELDAKLRMPGVANAWTQPIINRINMLSTGVRTDLGVKIFGDDLGQLERLAIRAEQLLAQVPGAVDLNAERTIGGTYVDLDVDRVAIARYGLNVADVAAVIEAAVGGLEVASTVEGRRRWPIRIRYARAWRGDLAALRRTLVPVNQGAAAPMAPGPAGLDEPGGGMGGMGGGAAMAPAAALPPLEVAGGRRGFVPLGQLVTVKVSAGPPMISSEDARLRSVVFLNVRGRDMGSFVSEAKAKLTRELSLPTGYTLAWSGQYENQERAQARLRVLIPLVLAFIVAQLWLTFRSLPVALLVLSAVPFAFLGGLVLQAWLGDNFSVAVWVGYIALAGVAVETGIVMMAFLQEAYARRAAVGPPTPEAIDEAARDGAMRRLRPILMTGFMGLLGLLPVMWSEGVGADVMRPIAAPMVGGLLTSTLMVLVVLPAAFATLKRWELRRARPGDEAGVRRDPSASG
jgi:Cu(I)/Ag(I) efflux system membrane protein CusA/SilA